MDAALHWTTTASSPPDALAGRSDIDVISPETARTLPALFRERVRRSGDAVAYRQHDPRLDEWRDYSWNETAREVDRWIAALRSEKIPAGERVAIQLRNCWQWVVFDQAAMACGLVVVPIYVEDRPDNVAYVIEQTTTRLLLLENGAQWRDLMGEGADEDTGEARRLDLLRGVVVLEDPVGDDPRVTGVEVWLAKGGDLAGHPLPDDGDALATIVFTSGTTGRPKGVMLSHRNMLADAWSGLHSVAVLPTDTMLSFLPLSHMFERTIGYYLPIMAGARVAFNR
ncbi:MAG: AMP-binding protein, partial [Pseudomonadota bacterium]|nr:AMP-binding protein [Pseudomonadota bacterium]